MKKSRKLDYPNRKDLIGRVGEKLEKYDTVTFYNIKGRNPYRICIAQKI